MTLYPLPVPLLGVQLRGKHNPVLVALSLDEPIEVEVEVEESSEPRVVVEGEPSLGWRGELALKSFVEVLSERLEQPLLVRVSYSASLFHVSGVYAVLTYAIVEGVAEAGGYALEPMEVAEAANSIDWDAGVELDYVDAARVAIAKRLSIVYRRGEEAVGVNLRGGVVELVGEVELGEVIEDVLDEEIRSVLTRLAGISVAVWSRRVVEQGWEGLASIWRIASRIENGLYYMLFGVEPAEEGCKWTPGLQTVFAVCVDKGLGDKVKLR